MSVVLLANVGHRDLTRGGQSLRSQRVDGEWILNNFDECKAELSLPMLSVVVEWLLKQHEKIQVVLYGTDQPDGTPAHHRDGDTIHVARIIVKLLESKHGRKKIEESRVKAIRSNPSLYDDMISFFRAEFTSSGKSNQWMNKVESCYVFPVGGTPAANMGLMLAAIDGFGENCHTLYLEQGGSHVTQMDVGDQIRRATARKLAADHLRDQSFGAAAPLLREADAPAWTVELVHYARNRYHFDFEAAVEALDRAIAACAGDWNVRRRLSQLRESLAELRDLDTRAVMRELYHNAALAYRRDEYAAFLGLVFRIQEEALAFIVQELYPWLPGVKEGTNKGDEEFRAALEGRPALWSYLKTQKVDGQGLRPDKPNIEVLAALVRSCLDGPERLESNGSRERVEKAYDLLYKRLLVLKKLRNKCIIAHGSEGVSERVMKEKYGDGDPIADIAAGLEALGIQLGDDPFEVASRLALEGLEKL